METSGIRQNFVIQKVSSTNNLVNSGNTLPQISVTSHQNSEVINFRDISVAEINNLIQKGNDEFLDVVPFISPQMLNKVGYDQAVIGEQRINFLAQVETSLEFKKSKGEDVSILENLLERMKMIDGEPFRQEFSAIV